MNLHSPSTADQDLAAILSRQREAFLREGPPSREKRAADLRKLRKAILARRVDLEAAISADFGGRSRHETAIMEIFPILATIDYLNGNLRRFMRPERRRVGPFLQMGRARVEYQPLGVIGIMAPWNYPASLTLTPLATAIAAGNRAMLKPSETTPATSGLLARLLAEIFPPEEVAVATGDAALGAAFSALPFDHLLFTGGTEVGRKVMRAASANLTPVTLELGGKSPVLIAPGFPLERAAAEIAYGKLANAGQTCIAPDYVLVQDSEAEAFLAAYDKAAARLYPQGFASPDYSAIVNDRHLARLQALISEAEAKGAKLHPVGVKAASGDLGRKLAPLAVTGVTEAMAVAREEIFGPILPILTYREFGEALAYVNARPRPLALYLFAESAEIRRRTLDGTTSGGVTINGVFLHNAQENLPFGGVGPSGMGAYHGPEGFKAFSHAKAVFEQGRWNGASLMRPPFGARVEKLLRFVLR